MAEKCFDQLLGARSNQKLVEIHNSPVFKWSSLNQTKITELFNFWTFQMFQLSENRTGTSLDFECFRFWGVWYSDYDCCLKSSRRG